MFPNWHLTFYEHVLISKNVFFYQQILIRMVKFLKKLNLKSRTRVSVSSTASTLSRNFFSERSRFLISICSLQLFKNPSSVKCLLTQPRYKLSSFKEGSKFKKKYTFTFTRRILFFYSDLISESLWRTVFFYKLFCLLFLSVKIWRMRRPVLIVIFFKDMLSIVFKALVGKIIFFWFFVEKKYFP